MATAPLSPRSPAAALVLVILAMVCASIALMQSVNGQVQCGPTVGASCSGSNCCSKNGYCGTQSQYCGSGCQKGYGKCSSCFPASATVMTRGGITKPISELAIGEEVAVQTSNGRLEYDAVYAHGHLDPYALSDFVVLTLSSLQNVNVTKTLELSPHHFTIVQGLKNTLEYKVAEDVRVGDRMFATHGDNLQFSTFLVSGVEKQVMKGLYNPFTLKGTIVVNDVLASCHSEWFLYSTLKRMCGAHVLPSIYQATLTPVRMLYNGMGKDAYKSLYNKIDSRFNIAESGSGFYGYFKLLSVAFSPSSYETHAT